jgi:peptidoglycan/LPS O-acetylase OafA/YrhL
MAYWRIADIPELRGLDPRSRRTRWSEAVSRSHSIKSTFMLLGLIVVGALLVGGMPLVFPSTETGWRHYTVLLAMWMLVFGSNDWLVTQPRARRWLREHPPVTPA